jgi:hypothetical protein
MRERFDNGIVCGALRYGEFLAAIADPGHEEHESFRKWSGGEFNPKRFDLGAPPIARSARSNKIRLIKLLRSIYNVNYRIIVCRLMMMRCV